jgi:glycosyltransferase involved in cell wall biosynthesis
MARLMFVTGSLAHGGAERHAVALMNRLCERGHECHAVYVKNEAGLESSLKLGGAGTLRCLGAARYLDCRALRVFVSQLRRVRPEVVIAANPYALMYAWLALRLSRQRRPLVVTYHSTRLLGAKEQLTMLLYRLFFWTADCTVFVCESQKRHCMRRAVLSRRNEVIHNGVDTERFRADGAGADRGEQRRTLGFSDADYVIGICGLLRPEKNHLQMVDAVAALREGGIPARVLMIGDGPMRAAVENRARVLGVQAYVVITGMQQDVRPYVAACDAVALCSRTEAFSMAAIEAMALGRPVVHSEVGGAAEMIEAGRNGFLFPAGDTPAFVAKLRALADRTLRSAMGDHARRIVEARFTEASMVERYERMLLGL